MPINLKLVSIGNILEKTGYKNSEKTVFILEGVSYYLDRGSVDAILSFVSHTTQGSLIAFDYIVSVTPENQGRYHGAAEFVQSMKQHHMNEEILFSLLEVEIKSFLQRRGMKLIEHLNVEGTENKYLLKDDGSLLGHMVGCFRLVKSINA